MTLRRKGLIKEAATLVSGNVLAQVIALMAYLVLTRIYSPADFALFNIFYSYIEVLIILSTCKYELAVVVADNENEAAAISRFAMRMNTALSLLLLTIVFLLYLTSSLPGDSAQLGLIALLIPPMVWFSGTSRVYMAIFNRIRDYRLIAASTTGNSAVGSLLKILLGLLGMNNAGMPLGTVLGQALANLLYRFKLRRQPLPDTTKEQCLTAAKKHKNFPLYAASKDFVNVFSYNLPFLWLALYFDKVEVGLFGLALTFTSRPANLINSAIERVLYTRVAEAVRNRQPVAQIIRHYLLYAAVVVLPISIALWFAAEPLFTFLFSGKWEGCGVYVQALLPWIVLTFGSSALSFIPNVFSTQRIEFGFYLVLLLLRIAAIAAGIYAGSFLLAIRLYATAGTLVVASLLAWYLFQVRRYERSLKW